MLMTRLLHTKYVAQVIQHCLDHSGYLSNQLRYGSRSQHSLARQGTANHTSELVERMIGKPIFALHEA